MTRIVAALERGAKNGDFVSPRTRAFAYLLWEGAVRTKIAVWLNAEEVVQDPHAIRIQVVEEVVQRSCEGNNYRRWTFLMSDRTRSALVDYLKVPAWLSSVRSPTSHLSMRFSSSSYFRGRTSLTSTPCARCPHCYTAP